MHLGRGLNDQEQGIVVNTIGDQTPVVPAHAAGGSKYWLYVHPVREVRPQWATNTPRSWWKVGSCTVACVSVKRWAQDDTERRGDSGTLAYNNQLTTTTSCRKATWRRDRNFSDVSKPATNAVRWKLGLPLSGKSSRRTQLARCDAIRNLQM